MTEPPNDLIDNRADPDARAVLEDFELTANWRPARLGVAVSYLQSAVDAAADAAVDDADAADDADDADADAADADAAAAADDDADAAADDDAADAADDDADAADAIERLQRVNQLLTGEIDLEDGLKIIQIPGRYGGWSATFVCWLKRVRGDEWAMVPGYRAIYRTGQRRGLPWLAKNGPGDDYKLKDASEVYEDAHRLIIKRSLRADEKAWAKFCPRPKDWKAAE